MKWCTVPAPVLVPNWAGGGEPQPVKRLGYHLFHFSASSWLEHSWIPAVFEMIHLRQVFFSEQWRMLRSIWLPRLWTRDRRAKVPDDIREVQRAEWGK
jgi:hypothetical protein